MNMRQLSMHKQIYAAVYYTNGIRCLSKEHSFCKCVYLLESDSSQRRCNTVTHWGLNQGIPIFLFTFVTSLEAIGLI